MARRNSTTANTSDDSIAISAGQTISNEVEINTVSSSSNISETVVEIESQSLSNVIRRDESDNSSSNDNAGLDIDQGSSITNSIDTARNSTSTSFTIGSNAGQRTDAEITAVIENEGFIKKQETYTHDQGMPSTLWTIEHNLDKLPSATVVDTTGKVVTGEITYNNTNKITIEFNASFSGLAYLN